MENLDVFDLKVLATLEALKKDGKVKELPSRVPCNDNESAWILTEKSKENR